MTPPNSPSAHDFRFFVTLAERAGNRAPCYSAADAYTAATSKRPELVPLVSKLRAEMLAVADIMESLRAAG